MPPKFMSSSFKFGEDDHVPEHIEGYPSPDERNPQKIWLEGVDTFSDEYYPLSIDIDGFSTAAMLKAARFRLLEEEQPTESSGGQDGIQDGVFIRLPG